MTEEMDNTDKDPMKKYAHLEGWDRSFAHMWDLFFGPELVKRKAQGALPEGFSLYMGQVLFSPEGQGKNRVLLNDEVRGDALIRARRPIEKGEKITVTDLENIERFDLPDELLDHGHFTIIRSGEGWRMIFNFLYGRAKAQDHLLLARQFFEASNHSATKGHAGPAVDNLYSAAELVSKAELILHRNPAVESKKHGRIASAINAWSRLGNIDAAFIALFNRLAQQRPAARYGNAENRPPAPSRDDLELVQAMIERGLARVGKTTDRTSPGGDDKFQ